MEYDDNNVFAKIIRGDLSCDKIYEDDELLAFMDISPAAPVHVLVVPKGKYVSFDDFTINAEARQVGEFFAKVRMIAEKAGVTRSGYRIITNHGSDATQTVPHFHVHIIGGRPLGGLLGS